MKANVEWEYTHCPYCGHSYPFIKGGYIPSTCGKFECLQKYLQKETKGGERREDNNSSSKR